MSNAGKKIPTVTSKIAPDLRQFVNRVRESLNGIDGTIDGRARNIVRNYVTGGAGGAGRTTPEGPGAQTEEPGKPTGLTATSTLLTINVKWDAAPFRGFRSTELWAASYDPDTEDPQPQDAELLISHQGTLYIHQAEQDVHYRYWVRHTNIDGAYGPWSDPAEASVTWVAAPPEVEGLTATASGQSIEVSWTPTAYMGKEATEVYAAQTATRPETPYGLSSASKITFAMGLSETWYFWARHTNVDGESSEFAGPVSATTYAGPAVPDIDATATYITPSTVQIAWARESYTGMAGVNIYRLPSDVLLGHADGSVFFDHSAPADTSSYRVAHVNSAGVEGASLTVTALADAGVDPAEMPTKPTGIAAERLFMTARVSWDYPAYSGHRETIVYANGVEVGRSIATTFVFEPTATQRISTVFTLKHVNRDGVLGPVSDGSAAIDLDALPPSAYLALLDEYITGDSTGFYQSLSERVDLVDGPAYLPGSVAERLEAEAAARAAVSDRVDELDVALADVGAAATFSTAHDYAVGALALLDGVIYRALGAMSAPSPTPPGPSWEVVGDFAAINEALRVNADAITALNTVSAESGSANASTLSALQTTVEDPATGLVAKASTAALNSAISTEQSARASAINSLSTTFGNELDAEASARATAISQAVSQAKSDVYGANVSAFTKIDAKFDSVDSAVGSRATITSLNSAISTEQSARASAINTVMSAVDDNEAAVQTEASTRADETGDLFAQYTVKVDTGGYVSGFGLASSARVDSTPYSEFIVRANRFAVGYPGRSDIIPFVVQTYSTTLNGESVPRGVYINQAFIKNGSIESAKIGDLSADKITGGTITGGTIYVDDAIQSTGWASGATKRWQLGSDGVLRANSAVITGSITATSGSFTGTVYATAGSFQGSLDSATLYSTTISATGVLKTQNVVSRTSGSGLYVGPYNNGAYFRMGNGPNDSSKSRIQVYPTSTNNYRFEIINSAGNVLLSSDDTEITVDSLAANKITSGALQVGTVISGGSGGTAWAIGANGVANFTGATFSGDVTAANIDASTITGSTMSSGILQLGGATSWTNNAGAYFDGNTSGGRFRIGGRSGTNNGLKSALVYDSAGGLRLTNSVGATAAFLGSGGFIDGDDIDVRNLSADNITTGSISVDRMPALATANGVFSLGGYNTSTTTGAVNAGYYTTVAFFSAIVLDTISSVDGGRKLFSMSLTGYGSSKWEKLKYLPSGAWTFMKVFPNKYYPQNASSSAALHFDSPGSHVENASLSLFLMRTG